MKSWDVRKPSFRERMYRHEYLHDQHDYNKLSITYTNSHLKSLSAISAYNNHLLPMIIKYESIFGHIQQLWQQSLIADSLT